MVHTTIGEIPTWYDTLNGMIAVEPFKMNAVEKAGVATGFATAKQKTELAELKVVFGTKEIRTPATVYVAGDLCVTADAKKVYTIGEQKFILIPVSEVKVVRFN